MDIEKLVYKLPQELETIRMDLSSYSDGITIFPKLASMKAPIDVNTPTNLLNASALKTILQAFQDRKRAIDSNPSSTSLSTDIDGLISDINTQIRTIDGLISELTNINRQLDVKITSYESGLSITIQDSDIVKVAEEQDFLRVVDTYTRGVASNDTSTKGKLKTLFDTYITSGTTPYASKPNKQIYDFIMEYNNLMGSISDERELTDLKTNKLYSTRYFGVDTKPISNNMLKEPNTLGTIGDNIKDLLMIKLEGDPDISGTSIINSTLQSIYKPTFTGGGTVDDLDRVLLEINTKSKSYRQLYIDYVRKTELYNKYAIYDLSHSLYLLTILSNTLFVKSSFQIYKYIGRGMINFYRRIIENIYKKLKLTKFDNETEKLLVLEIKKKYYLTVVKLKNFLDNIVQKLTPKDIIDIDSSSPIVVQNFTILNHFKSILEKYNESQMNKLTIFGRINDIGMKLPNETQTVDLKYDETGVIATNYGTYATNTQYKENVDYIKDNKLFISDYDRRNLYAGYFIKNSTTLPAGFIEKDLFDRTKNQLLDYELNKFFDAEMKPVPPAPTVPNTKYFNDQSMFDIYTEIKTLYNSYITEPNKINDIIDSLEKIKKEKVLVKVGEIFQKILEFKKKISEKLNEKVEIENKIDEVKTSVDEVFIDDTLGVDARKTSFTSFKNKNSYLDGDLQSIKDTLNNDPNYKEDILNELENDKKLLSDAIKVALENLYAANLNVNEKVMWIRNFTCDAQKPSSCTPPSPSNIYDSTYTDSSTNKPSSCEINSNVPLLNGYKFTEVFDTQNFPQNSDMAAYMCLNNRLTSGTGVCLITYGYSGTGKSYTLFGSPKTQGLLQGTLSKLDGLEGVNFRLFEIYGKGMPYYDYWVKDGSGNDFDSDVDATTQLPQQTSIEMTKMNDIFNYLYVYKLQYDANVEDRINVLKPNTQGINGDKDWGVELYGTEISDYIKKVDDLRSGRPSNMEKIISSQSDNLEYLTIDKENIQDVFKNFSSFTDKVEQMRIDTQRVRETPNNKVSSRSILIYDFILKIMKEGVPTYVSFLIIDLPGREEIAPTFINKYVDEKTNPVIYKIIKDGFDGDSSLSEINKGIFKDVKKLSDGSYIEKTQPPPSSSITDVSPPIEIDKGTIYMKHLKAMLASFTLNPISIPIYACEEIENFIKKDSNYYQTNIKPVIEAKIPIDYKLRCQSKGVISDKRTIEITGQTFSLLDELYQDYYNEDIFFTTKIKFDSTTNGFKLVAQGDTTPVYKDLYKEYNSSTPEIDKEIDITSIKMSKSIYYTIYCMSQTTVKPPVFNTKVFLHEPTIDNIKKQFPYNKNFYDSGIGYYSFNNLLNIDSSGNINMENILHDRISPNVTNWNSTYSDKILIKINLTNKYNNNQYDYNKIFIFTGDTSNKKGNVYTSLYNRIVFSDKDYDYSGDEPNLKYLYGTNNDTYNGRQIKVLLFSRLIKRLIDQKKYNVLNDMCQYIVDEKINKYIKNHIDGLTIDKCKDLITELMNNNFKREALKDKFVDSGTITFNSARTERKIGYIDNVSNIAEYKKKIVYANPPINSRSVIPSPDDKVYLYESIKYDFYTTGFEGVYINENIIGLIKYLGKNGKPILKNDGTYLIENNKVKQKFLIENKNDRDMIDVIKQDKNNDFKINLTRTNLLNLSRLPNEGKIAEHGINKDRIDDYIDAVSAKPITDDCSGVFLEAICRRNIRLRSITPITQNIPTMYTYKDNIKRKIFNINENCKQLFTKHEDNRLQNFKGLKKIEDITTKITALTDTTLKNKAIKYKGGLDITDISNNKKGILPYIDIYVDYYYNPEQVDNYTQQTLESYKSSRIFCYDEPIIKSILEPYLSIIDDFKLFYLFGNYTKATRELKCAQQYELLETTNNFIEAITR